MSDTPRNEHESTDDRQTMADISHTPPHQTSAGGVWERGPETESDDAAPADD